MILDGATVVESQAIGNPAEGMNVEIAPVHYFDKTDELGGREWLTKRKNLR